MQLPLQFEDQIVNLFNLLRRGKILKKNGGIKQEEFSWPIKEFSVGFVYDGDKIVSASTEGSLNKLAFVVV